MARRLTWLVVAACMVAAVPAAASSGQISGYVRDARGVPQMGAVVQVIAGQQSTTAFTDARGFYRVDGLNPGNYSVRVSAASFLPSLREQVSLTAGAQVIINLTLNTLFEAASMLPARRKPAQPDDDWKWTLRSAANRPVLRVLDNEPLVVVSHSDSPDDRVLKAHVAFIAGVEAEGFGSAPDVSTAFSVEQSIFRHSTLSLRGNVGYGEGETAGTIRAAFRHRAITGTNPEIAITARRFATPDSVTQRGALSALALTISDRFALADAVELDYGGEIQAVQFARNVIAPFRPFGTLSVHLAPHSVLRYTYATSMPDRRGEKGFDSAPADLSESGPRMSLVNGQPVLERARHQEISLSQRFGNTSMQAAVFHDVLQQAALTGFGDALHLRELLPDVYSGTFSYNAGNLRTTGLRLVLQQRFHEDFAATFDYGYGGVLHLGTPGAEWDSAMQEIGTTYRHSLAAKLNAVMPKTRTRVISSYRWTSGQALSPVDMFNASPGHADPYLSVFVRQPFPAWGFLPGRRMEALVDVRNLLAEGYIPVVANDGSTMYLVQAARSVRGGVAFSF